MTGQLIQLPPIQHDPQIDQCLHNINLNMTPTEQPTNLETLIHNYNWIPFTTLIAYLAGLAMGTWLT